MSEFELQPPPWFAPIFWPLANLLAFLRIVYSNCDSDHHQKHNLEAYPFFSLRDHATALAGSMRSFIIAAFCVYVLHGGTDPAHGYPAFGRASKLASGWIIPLFARNIIGTWLIAGAWDWCVELSK
jgi:hypothetical protein